MMLSYPGENRTFRHSSKNSSTRKARKVYYVHQVIFNVHVQCIYETQFFFHTRCCLGRNLKKEKKKKNCFMTKVICMNENPPKERKRIVYNTCTYVLRLAFIKEFFFWKRRLRKSAYKCAYTCSCNNHWNLCCLLLDQH